MKQPIVILILAAVIICNGCYREKDFLKEEASIDDTIINLYAARSSLLATDEDTTQITVELPLEASDSGSVVTLTANNGTFLESEKNTVQIHGTITVENGKKKNLAIAVYKSSFEVGKTRILSKVGAVSKYIELDAIPNTSDSIKLTPSTLVLKSGSKDEISFEVNLFSKKGKVTPGQIVTISVEDPKNVAKGTFRVTNNRSDQNGKTSFVYSLFPDSTYFGELKVNAETANNVIPNLDLITIYIIK